jgi:allantoate deiminase
VGRIEARPGATNVIPASVAFTLDLRSTSDDLRKTAVERIMTEARRITDARGLQIQFEPFHDIETTPCAADLQDMLSDAISTFGHRPVRLPSGAGHDAQVMAKLCPAAMLFVRCRGGISHNPAECASEADMGLAVAALAGFISSASV